MKLQISMLCLALCSSTVFAKDVSNKSSAAEQVGYSFGYLMGRSNAESIKDLDIDAFVAGLKAASKGQTSSLTDEEWASTIADVQTHINNTLDRVGITQGAVGGRQNNLDQIMNSNSSLQTITSEAKANVSEIDLYEAISNVFLQENALTMAQQAFAKVNKSTLFDYL